MSARTPRPVKVGNYTGEVVGDLIRAPLESEPRRRVWVSVGPLFLPMDPIEADRLADALRDAAADARIAHVEPKGEPV